MTNKKLIYVLVVALSLLATTNSSAQKFDRGISFKDATVFVPKGQMLVGGTISYNDYKFYDYKILILDNFASSGYSLSVSPYISYFFANNLAAGARFAYKRSLIKLDKAKLSLTPDMAFEFNDIYNLQHTYYAGATFRNYISLGNSLRFGLFNEVRLTIGAGQGKMVSGKGENITGTFQKVLELGLDLVPGIIVFVSNEVAVEASVGVMGLKYKKVGQLTNQVLEGSFEKSAANFKIDIFSINIGISFYLPLVNKKQKS